MFFCTYEHYSDEQPINYKYIKNYEERECFVCFEIKAFNEARPIMLKNQNIYVTSCNCDSFIHKKCLQIWFDKNKICPICRIIVRDRMIKLSIINKLFSYGFYLTFYIFIISKKLLNLIYFLFLVYSFINFCNTNFFIFINRTIYMICDYSSQQVIYYFCKI